MPFKIANIERPLRARCGPPREGGWSYESRASPSREIGRQLGVSGKTAYKDISRSLADLAAKEQDHAREARQLDLARIDKALSGVMPKVEDGDPKAVLALCRLLERRAKLLGLDAPARVLHGGDPETGPIQIENLNETERVSRLRQLIDTARMRQGDLPLPSVPLLEYTRPNGHIADGAGGVDPDA